MKKILILILLALPVLAFGQLDTVNVGSSANSGTGESMRSAFLKVNDHIQAYNAAYLYRLSLSGAHTVALTTTGTTTLTLPTTGTLATTANLVSPAMTAPTVATTINPDANDGATLGQSGTAWSDLFLADDGVINWAAGDVTMARSQSEELTITANVRVTERLIPGDIYLEGPTPDVTISNTELAALDGVTGVEEGVSMVEWNNGIEDNYLKALQAAGSSIKVGSAMGFYPRVDHTLYDGKALWTLFYLSDTTDVTGVGYMLSTQGNYTADNYNGFAIYSVSGTTYTKIDSTANDGNLWKTAANTTAVKAFSAGPHELNPGIYYVFLVYNNSAQTTAPKLYYNNDLANAAFAGLTGTNKIQGVVNSQTTPPATETGGDVTADLEIPAIWLY